jgi:hypothetical protein
MLLVHPYPFELFHLDSLRCMGVVQEGLLVGYVAEVEVEMRIQGAYEGFALAGAQGTYGVEVAIVVESVSVVPGLDCQVLKRVEPEEPAVEYCPIGLWEHETAEEVEAPDFVEARLRFQLPTTVSPRLMLILRKAALSSLGFEE